MFAYNSQPFRAIKNLLLPFPDRMAVSVMYRMVYDRALDFDRPDTLTSWINAQKIKDNSFLGPYVDKLAAKKIVAQTIGEQYVTPVLWQGEDAADIPFTNLPYPVMIKTNHGSKRNVFLPAREPTREAAIVRSLNKTLRRKHGKYLRENHYDTVAPRVFVEPFLHDDSGHLANEFNLYMLDGAPALIQVVHRDHRTEWGRKNYALSYHDADWNRLNIKVFSTRFEGDYPPPPTLGVIFETAKRLSAPFAFVRVDLLSCGGITRFGELTFMPHGGFMPMFTPEMDRAFFEKLGPYKTRGYRREALAA